MRAVVVYESLWGNTAAVAHAIAEGIGEGTWCLATSEATADALKGVDLIVAGAPLLGFALPTENMRASIDANRRHPKADFSNPSLRSWLAGAPNSSAACAAFETGFRWSPGSATKAILKELSAKGYRPLGAGRRFLVKGSYGPLKDGEIARAQAWGAELARSAQ